MQRKCNAMSYAMCVFVCFDGMGQKGARCDVKKTLLVNFSESKKKVNKQKRCWWMLCSTRALLSQNCIVAHKSLAYSGRVYASERVSVRQWQRWEQTWMSELHWITAENHLLFITFGAYVLAMGFYNVYCMLFSFSRRALHQLKCMSMCSKTLNAATNNKWKGRESVRER